MVPPQLRSPNAQMPAIAGVTGAGADSITESRMNFSATIDMQQDLRDVFDEANRQNVSLYPVDPRGLAVFEFDLSEPSVGMETDRQYLNATMDSLRTLAENTDGRAIVNRNDLEAGMRQIMRYGSVLPARLQFLLPRRPTVNPRIKVRVKRPGLQVARAKYWALNAEQTSGAGAASPAAGGGGAEQRRSSTTCPDHQNLGRHARGENGRRASRQSRRREWPPIPLGPGAAVACVAHGRRLERVASFPGTCARHGRGVAVSGGFIRRRRRRRAGLARGLRRGARQDGVAAVGRGRFRRARFGSPRNRRPGPHQHADVARHARAVPRAHAKGHPAAESGSPGRAGYGRQIQPDRILVHARGRVWRRSAMPRSTCSAARQTMSELPQTPATPEPRRSSTSGRRPAPGEHRRGQSDRRERRGEGTGQVRVPTEAGACGRRACGRGGDRPRRRAEASRPRAVVIAIERTRQAVETLKPSDFVPRGRRGQAIQDVAVRI